MAWLPGPLSAKVVLPSVVLDLIKIHVLLSLTWLVSWTVEKNSPVTCLEAPVEAPIPVSFSYWSTKLFAKLYADLFVSTATCNANVAISFLIPDKSTLVNAACGIVPVILAPGIPEVILAPGILVKLAADP